MCRIGGQRSRGFLAYSGNNCAEKEGEACSNKGDNRSLHLKQCKVAKDEGIPHGWDIKVAQVGCGSETSGKIHFYVAFKIKDDGDDRNEFVDTGHRLPVLPRRKGSNKSKGWKRTDILSNSSPVNRLPIVVKRSVGKV